MELYLIRHGQSGNNVIADAARNRLNAAAGERLRTADPSLTETGQAQAQRVAEHLQETVDKTDLRDGVAGEGGHRIGRLFCSAMRRALQTAQPIGAALGQSPEVWLDVHEEGGIWLDDQDGGGRSGHAGLTRSDMAAQFPEFVLPDGFTETGWWNRPMETREQLISRAARVADEIQDRFADTEDRIAIVSHGTFLNFLLQHLVHGTHLTTTYFSNHNTAISRLDFNDGAVMLRYLNRVDHLPHDLVT